MFQKLKKGYFLGRRGIEQGRTVLFSKDLRLKNKFERPRDIFFNQYWANVATTVGAEIDSVGYGFFRLRKDGRTTFVKRGEVML